MLAITLGTLDDDAGVLTSAHMFTPAHGHPCPHCGETDRLRVIYRDFCLWRI